ncbi:hypothetical protein Ddye_005182 [Dipteronia dyeriana]|uniref:Reverse transcriptase domain-containing protein n=1 Tax=Dipteronia dyeriana TaxID=168575 RepID=A0AAD9XFT7_9ROSI|nr:hypothetical protein Ddye_005182 [Dipteronia dyeriana]
MTDFRPISCCNALYKIIVKIIANRIKVCLSDIISPSQSAFVAGRRIGDNILLVQELMRDYHKDAGMPKLALKVDLMKAFDMVDWGFLLDTPAAFHFPLKVINWIKACLTTPKFSIFINGELAGFFSGKRGLQQGDPMSPYLFVIVMEVLSKLLANHIMDTPNFKYHWRSDKLNLSHISFTDDLIMLCPGSYHSALVLKSALDEFFLLLGLCANHAKSNIFISSYLLKGTNLWEVKAPYTCSWNMRKLLLLRPFARPLIQHIIGNGLKTSLWFDNWHPDGPIQSEWSSRVIYDSGVSINAKVMQLFLMKIGDGLLLCPLILLKFGVICLLTTQNLLWMIEFYGLLLLMAFIQLRLLWGLLEPLILLFLGIKLCGFRRISRGWVSSFGWLLKVGFLPWIMFSATTLKLLLRVSFVTLKPRLMLTFSLSVCIAKPYGHNF